MVPGGNRSLPTPSARAVVAGGLLQRTQWTHFVRGGEGSGASGSSTLSAKLLVPSGTPDHESGGEASCPSQVCRAGISSPWAKLDDVSENATAVSPYSP